MTSLKCFVKFLFGSLKFRWKNTGWFFLHELFPIIFFISSFYRMWIEHVSFMTWTYHWSVHCHDQYTSVHKACFTVTVRDGVAQWLTYFIFISQSWVWTPLNAPVGEFKEQIRACFHNQTKIYRGPVGRFFISN